MSSPTVQELLLLTGKAALITGGARHLGYDMALALAEAGADVAITSRTIEDAMRSAESITGRTGKRAVGFRCDVRDEKDVCSLVDEVMKHYGKIDILVNNAGNVLSAPETAQIETRPFEQWRETLAV